MSSDDVCTLPVGWRQLTVEQLVADGVIQKPLDGNHGGIHPKSADYVENGVPFIMASDLDGGRVDLAGCKFISKEQTSGLRKGFAKAGDVLLSHKATIGRTAIVQDSEHPFIVLTPQVTYYRISDVSQLNAIYLKAYFDSTLFQTILGQWAGAGSTRAYLGITGQLKLPIIVPPIDFQNFVAEQSVSLNDKIQLNQKINQTLEQMAQAIFKSWFVDFDPVKVKIAARERWHALQSGNESASPAYYAGELTGRSVNFDLDTYMNYAAMQAISGKDAEQLARMQAQQPEEYAELYATAELFPSAMQDSELGEIPEGWEAFPLYNTAEYVNGAAFKAKDFTDNDSGLPIIKIAELKQGITGTTKFTNRNITEKYRINTGDVLYSWSGSPETSLEVFKWFGGEGWLNQHIFKLNFNSSQNIHFTYFLLKQIKPLLVSTAKQKQTTGLGHITVADMKRIKIPYPKKELMIAFSKLVLPFYDRASEACKESHYLSSLRDTLLPKLLSGELSVADIESEVEA